MTANIFVILHSTNLEDVIKDFVAVEIIQQIDNIVAETLTDMDAGEKVNENEVWISTENDKLTDCEILAMYWPGSDENDGKNR